MHEDRTKEDVVNEHGLISSSRAGWALLGLSAALVAAAAFLVRDAPTDVPGLEVATAEDVVDAVLHLAYPLVGALIIVRNPANLFGWVFCLGALCFEANLFAGAYSTYGTFTHPGSLPAPQLLSLVSDLLLVPSFVLVVTMVPLLFPTGRPPTRRWWIVGVAAAVTIVLATTSMAIRPGPVDEDVPSAGANPLGIAGADAVADALEFAALVVFLLAAGGSLASAAVRIRRSHGEERRQLKIFLVGVAVVFAVFFVPDEPLGLGGEVGQIALAVVGILALPIAVAIALLQPAKTPLRLQHSRPMSSRFADNAVQAGNEPPPA
jgi:hypothetical protein